MRRRGPIFFTTSSNAAATRRGRAERLVHGIAVPRSEADGMHVLLVLRADQLEGCTDNSEEARELGMIAEVLEAYECKRWPDGKVPGGKG